MDYIHINCDLGEGGEYDSEIMPYISACNIACGGHAGTLETMRRTIDLALEHSVQIGAHPSYPDKENFGRESISIPQKDLQKSLLAQIIGLKQLIEAEGGELSHIKMHGALYNDSAKDGEVASVVLEVMKEIDEGIPLYVPPRSLISEIAKGSIPVVYEAFADRNYKENYQLVSRGDPKALITEKEKVFGHLYSLFLHQKISLENGKEIFLKADTFCLHSDTPDAVEILRYLKAEFEKTNIRIWKK